MNLLQPLLTLLRWVAAVLFLLLLAVILLLQRLALVLTWGLVPLGMLAAYPTVSRLNLRRPPNIKKTPPSR